MPQDKSPQKWKVIASEYLHKKAWLTVRKECIQIPDGIIIPEYYILEYPNWVNIIAITKDGKFVMVEQYRHGIEEVCMELCAGVCETSDKSPMDSAKRELLEETGFGHGTWTEFMRIAPNASANNNYSYCFIARNVEKIAEQNLDESEDLKVHLLTFEEVKQLLKSDKIVQATMSAPLWKYVAENQ